MSAEFMTKLVPKAPHQDYKTSDFKDQFMIVSRERCERR
jgi:hypothetical protein